MAKTSSIQKDMNLRAKVARYAAKRERLLEAANNESLSPEEQFKARIKLSEMPRNSSKVRIRNRCALTGRPRSFYRKFKMSRIALREYALEGQIPGMTKASW